jgi:hypothetical protein
MGIQILSTFTRAGVGNYPLLDDMDVKGGYRVVADTTARDAIPSNIRKAGMLVYVTATSQTFRLSGDMVTWLEDGGGSSSSVGMFSCSAGLPVQKAVYLSAGDTVDLADADDNLKQPLIGFVKSKPTSTTARVQYHGEMSGFTGLVPGETYFLSTTPGEIVKAGDPGFPSNIGDIVQRVGFAKNSDTLVVMVDRDYTVL